MSVPVIYRASTTFDGLDRPAAVTEMIAGQTFSQTTTYDAHSRPSLVTYASGVRTLMEYDATGAVVRIKNGDTGATYFERLDFDARGNVTSSRLGNGVQKTRTFDQASGHILGISSALPSGTAIQSLDYRFDVLGNLMERRDGLHVWVPRAAPR